MSGLIWGVNSVMEALKGRPDTVERIAIAEGVVNQRIQGELMTRAKEARVKVELVDRERLDRLTEGESHQGIVAEVKDFEYIGLPELIKRAKSSGRQPLIVLLDGIQDPHNLGAIIRSAHAFGAQGVVIMKDRAVQVTAVAVKASAGATAHCDVLGNLTDALHISPQTADTAMKIILGYLLVGSYGLLFWLWRQNRRVPTASPVSVA